MKQFIQKYPREVGMVILLLIVLISFKSCNDTMEIKKIRREFASLKDSVCTKTELRQISSDVTDLKTTVWGFMDSQTFVLQNFVEVSVKNKSTNDAWTMYSKKIKEITKGNERLVK